MTESSTFQREEIMGNHMHCYYRLNRVSDTWKISIYLKKLPFF